MPERPQHPFWSTEAARQRATTKRLLIVISFLAGAVFAFVLRHHMGLVVIRRLRVRAVFETCAAGSGMHAPESINTSNGEYSGAISSFRLLRHARGSLQAFRSVIRMIATAVLLFTTCSFVPLLQVQA